MSDPVSGVTASPAASEKGEYLDEKQVYQDVESVDTGSLDDIQRLKRAEIAKVRRVPNRETSTDIPCRRDLIITKRLRRST
jgi:hypothetical protein